MKYDFKKYAEAIKKAREAAYALRHTLDGGTCNMDEAYIYVPSMTESFARKLGCRILPTRRFGRLLMIGGVEGQAARRTAMAEAACKSLKTDGIQGAGVWYQMD